ncbi:hypothetical protein QZH41_013645 [Actinostola sp. cb2023]|nr:hypothetical protein QZH41_013645 [Actinostola sp. cb2023]
MTDRNSLIQIAEAVCCLAT